MMTDLVIIVEMYPCYSEHVNFWKEVLHELCKDVQDESLKSSKWTIFFI